MTPEHETWIVEEGARVVEKAHTAGPSSLTPIEQLVRLLWTADYCMQNAGDLQNLDDMEPNLNKKAAALAASLGLTQTAAVFSLARAEFETKHFGVADAVCEEIMGALVKT